MRIIFLGLAILLLLASSVAAAPASQQITSLPGLPAAEFAKLTPQYSGYVTVDQTAGRALFYWFATAQTSKPTEAPLIVWLQGGPGCSSLIGLLTEHGPVRMAAAGSSADLEINGWSWSRLANVLYIEAPAGVGFSYSNTSSDYNTNNELTAQDNYVFLQNWSLLFPEFSNSPLWLTGESYAGDYVPQLARQIIQGSDASLNQRLSGLMIGNPVLSCDGWKKNGNTVLADLFYYHGMIPFNVWQQWHQSGCVGTTADPPLHCQLLGKQIQIMSGVPDMVDPDNLYTDQCTGNASLEVDPVTSSCSQFQLRRNLWLNRVDVQAAIHARNFYWVPCTNSSSVLNYTSDWPNMLPYYAQFTSQKPSMRILIYSGDVDIATVPHAYTQMCIHEMNRTVVSDWRPWKIENALAGYTQDFEGLSFATVKGAGHEVPMFSPRAAFEMVQRFLFNQKL